MHLSHLLHIEKEYVFLKKQIQYAVGCFHCEPWWPLIKRTRVLTLNPSCQDSGPDGTNRSGDTESILASARAAAFDSGLKICQIRFTLKNIGRISQPVVSGMNLPDKVLNYFKLQSIDFKSKAIFYVTALAVAVGWCIMALASLSVHWSVHLSVVIIINRRGHNKFL